MRSDFCFTKIPGSMLILLYIGYYQHTRGVSPFRFVQRITYVYTCSLLVYMAGNLDNVLAL